MPQFSANLSMLFPERPFLQRFAAAAQAGFSAVEFMFPYAFAIADLRDAIAHSKVRVVLHNLPPGDWDAGDRGIACHPNRTEEFRDSVAQAIAYASALQVPRLNCLAGCT
ncbi:MAG: TIM barrel protein, partial [Comamonas sp.]|nr:TIM barrel protein [Comamonas sp.]